MWQRKHYYSDIFYKAEKTFKAAIGERSGLALNIRTNEGV